MYKIKLEKKFFFQSHRSMLCFILKFFLLMEEKFKNYHFISWIVKLEHM